MRLRTHLVLLVLLVLAAIVPLLIFTIFIVRQESADHQRRVLDRGMRDTARALSLALDGEINTSWAVLETLAASRDALGINRAS